MGKLRGVVTQITPLTDRISSLTIAATGGGVLPGWAAGAHAVFDVPGSTRAYSLVAFDVVPAAPESYRIAVQREDAGQGGSRAMHGLAVGDDVLFEAPKNSFAVETQVPAVLLAGGSRVHAAHLNGGGAAGGAAGVCVSLRGAVGRCHGIQR